MPGINGIDLAIRIKQLCPDCQVLLLSALTVSFDLQEQAKLQGHHFEILAKPVHPTELLARLKARFKGGEL